MHKMSNSFFLKKNKKNISKYPLLNFLPSLQIVRYEVHIKYMNKIPLVASTWRDVMF